MKGEFYFNVGARISSKCEKKVKTLCFLILLFFSYFYFIYFLYPWDLKHSFFFFLCSCAKLLKMCKNCVLSIFLLRYSWDLKWRRLLSFSFFYAFVQILLKCVKKFVLANIFSLFLGSLM